MMDQLFKRYADPFSLINGYIRTHRFDWFLNQFILTINEESNDQVKWDYYLHRVFDKSFEEWDAENETMNKNKNITKEQLETTLNNSLSILNKFNPS